MYDKPFLNQRLVDIALVALLAISLGLYSLQP
jgi:hypothetical protein